MIITNTVPTHHTSSSLLDGRVTPARSEQDGAKDTPPEDALVVVIPSFHLNTSVPLEQYAHTETVPQEPLPEGILAHPQLSSGQPATPVNLTTPAPFHEDILAHTQLSGYQPATPVDLTTQAQALMQSMIKMTENSGPVSQIVAQTFNRSTQTTSASTQENSRLDVTVKAHQGMEQTNTSNPIKTSAADLNVLLNQAPQGLLLTTHSPGQVPLIQAQALPSTTHQPTAQTQGSEWAAVRVDSSSGKWGEQMIQVLQDRVTFQAQQNLQEAKIRLDPPDLGKLDLLVRVEGDRLSVQINANTAVTREALMQVSDRLRAELQEQNFVHVDVNVGSDQGQERQGYSDENQQEDPTIFSARESNAFQANTTTNESEHWLNTQA